MTDDDLVELKNLINYYFSGEHGLRELISIYEVNNRCKKLSRININESINIAKEVETSINSNIRTIKNKL